MARLALPLDLTAISSPISSTLGAVCGSSTGRCRRILLCFTVIVLSLMLSPLGVFSRVETTRCRGVEVGAWITMVSVVPEAFVSSLRRFVLDSLAMSDLIVQQSQRKEGVCIV